MTDTQAIDAALEAITVEINRLKGERQKSVFSQVLVCIHKKDLDVIRKALIALKKPEDEKNREALEEYELCETDLDILNWTNDHDETIRTALSQPPQSDLVEALENCKEMAGYTNAGKNIPAIVDAALAKHKGGA